MLSEFYEGKKVFVTGGAGFIGSHMVEMLVDMGAKVTVPVRKTTNTRYLKAVEKDVKFVEADLFIREQVEKAMQGHELVMHLAAAKGGGIAHSMTHHGSLFRDNMLSFINVLDSARVTPSVYRTLVTSSACVYPHDARVPAPEEDGNPGGAGFIGSHMVEMLVDMGAKVTVPVRKTTNTRYLKAVEKDVKFVEADLFIREQVEKAMQGHELVMHLAAAKGGGIAHSMTHHGSLFRDNMLSFINVLDSARVTPSVYRTLVTSSACVYPHDARVPAPEGTS